MKEKLSLAEQRKLRQELTKLMAVMSMHLRGLDIEHELTVGSIIKALENVMFLSKDKHYYNILKNVNETVASVRHIYNIVEAQPIPQNINEPWWKINSIGQFYEDLELKDKILKEREVITYG